jgi:hypothetical protein
MPRHNEWGATSIFLVTLIALLILLLVVWLVGGPRIVSYHEEILPPA